MAETKVERTVVRWDGLTAVERALLKAVERAVYWGSTTVDLWVVWRAVLTAGGWVFCSAVLLVAM